MRYKVNHYYEFDCSLAEQLPDDGLRIGEGILFKRIDESLGVLEKMMQDSDLFSKHDIMVNVSSSCSLEVCFPNNSFKNLKDDLKHETLNSLFYLAINLLGMNIKRSLWGKRDRLWKTLQCKENITRFPCKLKLSPEEEFGNSEKLIQSVFRGMVMSFENRKRCSDTYIALEFLNGAFMQLYDDIRFVNLFMSLDALAGGALNQNVFIDYVNKEYSDNSYDEDLLRRVYKHRNKIVHGDRELFECDLKESMLIIADVLQTILINKFSKLTPERDVI